MPKPPPIPNPVHTLVDGVHHCDFGQGGVVTFTPVDCGLGVMKGVVMALHNGVEVYQNLTDLMDSRQITNFAQYAHGLNGSHPWALFLPKMITPIQRAMASSAEKAATPPVPQEPWPVMDHKAYYGLAGTLVVAIDPYTEADPYAVLLNILTAFGNLIGDRAHFMVEHTRHALRLFVVLVGKTSKGRKGQSWSTPRHIFSAIDESWGRDRVTSGLSSGEGLIYAVRDERWERQPIREKGRVVDYQKVMVDEGVADK